MKRYFDNHDPYITAELTIDDGSPASCAPVDEDSTREATMGKIRFYSVFIRTDGGEPFIFGLEEIKIKKVYPDGTIELYLPYFICDQYSTYFFAGRSGNAIDREYKTRYGCVFYSTDKHKCMDYLMKKREDEMRRKSKNNMEILQKNATSLWHDFQCIDMSNGDRQRFKDWIINLFLEDK